MKSVNQAIYPILKAAFVITLLSACGSSDEVVSDILDNIDTEHNASISYVNALERSSTFYTKSTVYPNSVFNSDHRVREILPNSASTAITHEWIDGAKQTEFAFEDSNSASQMKKTTKDLQDNKRYWSVAWTHDGDPELSVFEKEPVNMANRYSVRVFANTDLDVWLVPQQQFIALAKAGQASNSFSVEGCGDLQVGAHQIDLCQSADFGRSYLVVVNDESGSVIITQE
jgi:hypothetical protein